MTRPLLQINRPTLMTPWTQDQMKAAAVRIHARFQGLLISVIESADWANYRLTDDPVEAGRPPWPIPGEFCDLVLQRREGEVVAALEVKTRHIKSGDHRTPWDIMDSVLDEMGTQLTRLQSAAKQSDALWIVALGLHRTTFQHSAINHRTPFEVIMVWGRDIGRDTPSGRGYWHNLQDLDRAMCSYKEPSKFWDLASLKRRPTPQAQPVTRDLEELIRSSSMTDVMKAALLAVMVWPEKALPLRIYMRDHATAAASEYQLQHATLTLIEGGIIKGYTKGKRAHQLTIDERALVKLLEELESE